MRFIDSSTFLYAFLRPERPPPPDVAEMKANAQNILKNINDGEPVVTSVIHVSEIANILETRIPSPQSRQIISDIITKKTIEVTDVTRHLYTSSLRTAETHDVGLNDALAFNIMQQREIHEIYSFDKHFDELPGVRRLTH